MSDSYQVKKGTGHRLATSYQDLLARPGRYMKDDGLEVPLPSCPQCEAEAQGTATGPHNDCPRTQPPCPDCKGKGKLLWSEAGYVPWHRICNYCGSHWELHPAPPPGGFIRRARFY